MDDISDLHEVADLLESELDDETNVRYPPTEKFLSYFASRSEQEFYNRYRVSKETFLYVFSKLELPPKTRGDSIDCRFDFLIYLRYLATGSFQEVSGDLFAAKRHVNFCIIILKFC